MKPISAQQIKQLRELSGAPMAACKNALIKAEGDFDKALEKLTGDDDSSSEYGEVVGH